ncbi:hypothetical protein AVEN_157390-1, partial [Araneus ventricosus]
ISTTRAEALKMDLPVTSLYNSLWWFVSINPSQGSKTTKTKGKKASIDYNVNVVHCKM